MHDDRSLQGAFRFAYDGPTIRFGDEAVQTLGTELGVLEADRALVVCGATVGATSSVIDPVTTGVGDRLAGVFDGTTPQKRLGTALDVRDRYRSSDADALVGLGGGSSLDVATVARAAIADDRSREAIAAEFQQTGTITVPDSGLPPLVVVPTTLAGAEQSMGAGITATQNGELKGGGVSDPALRADCVVYDPTLVATTPAAVLCGSAMNGFDKGVETLYSRHATPVTDATAIEGLRYLDQSLRNLRDDSVTAATLAPVLTGVALVQYGISRPDASTLSIIHAFGHGLTAYGDLQQGVAHAVMAPHVLDYVFDVAPEAHERLARAFDCTEAADPGQAVVERVAAIRDALELPNRLRETDAPDPDRFDQVATAVLQDAFMANGPRKLEPSHEELRTLLDAAY